MPSLKAAKKALRQNKIRRVRNLRKKRALYSLLKNFKKVIGLKNEVKAETGAKAEAEKILPEIYKRIDKNKKAGIFKKNTASRKKSKAARMINKLKTTN